MTDGPIDFATAFEALTGYPPFPWQAELYKRFAAGEFPSSCNIPTGLGKTAAVALAWLCDRLVHSFNPQLLGMASSPHLLSGDADPCGADCSGS